MTTSQTQRKTKRDTISDKMYPNKHKHSRAATDNLMLILYTERIGIALIEEPHFYENRPLGIIQNI